MSATSVDDRLFRIPPWLAPLRSSDRGLSARHHRCYFRLRLLALPQPLAFRLALCGHLSALRLIDSNTCLATNTRHTLPMLFPAPLPDHSGFGYWQISYTVSVRPQPKPRPVTTVHRKYFGRILEPTPKSWPTLHLQYLQPSSPTIFIVCAAGPFPSETLGLASRQNRRCSLLLLRPCRGSPCCLPPLPLAEQLQKTQASSDSGHRTLALMAMYLSQIYLQRKNEGNL